MSQTTLRTTLLLLLASAFPVLEQPAPSLEVLRDLAPTGELGAAMTPSRLPCASGRRRGHLVERRLARTDMRTKASLVRCSFKERAGFVEALLDLIERAFGHAR